MHIIYHLLQARLVWAPLTRISAARLCSVYLKLVMISDPDTDPPRVM